MFPPPPPAGDDDDDLPRPRTVEEIKAAIQALAPFYQAASSVFFMVFDHAYLRDFDEGKPFGCDMHISASRGLLLTFCAGRFKERLPDHPHGIDPVVEGTWHREGDRPVREIVTDIIELATEHKLKSITAEELERAHRIIFSDPDEIIKMARILTNSHDLRSLDSFETTRLLTRKQTIESLAVLFNLAHLEKPTCDWDHPQMTHMLGLLPPRVYLDPLHATAWVQRVSNGWDLTLPVSCNLLENILRQCRGEDIISYREKEALSPYLALERLH